MHSIEYILKEDDEEEDKIMEDNKQVLEACLENNRFIGIRPGKGLWYSARLLS